MNTKNTKVITPESLGKKIKIAREYRGLTQKQLGIMCGFNAATAQVRIGQYENNSRTPTPNILEKIADALNISPFALTPKSISNIYDARQTLFDMEKLYGLCPIEIDGQIYLEFSKNLHSEVDFMDSTVYSFGPNSWHNDLFLEHWYDMYRQTQPLESNTTWEKEPKYRDYLMWQLEYPASEPAYIEKQNLLIETAYILDQLNKINIELEKLKKAPDTKKRLEQKEALLDEKEVLLEQKEKIRIKLEEIK